MKHLNHGLARTEHHEFNAGILQDWDRAVHTCGVDSALHSCQFWIDHINDRWETSQPIKFLLPGELL